MADDPRVPTLFSIIGLTAQGPNLNVAKAALVAQSFGQGISAFVL
jgi:hypothetical protein